MARNPNWTRDELILALDLYFRVNPVHTSDQHPEVHALSKLLNRLPNKENARDASLYRNPNGVYMKMCNYLRFDQTYHGKGLERGGKLEELIWNEFSHNRERLAIVANAIRSAVGTSGKTNPEALPIQDDDEEFLEGGVLTAIHKRRERNSKAVKRKKETVLAKEEALKCEICGFDFALAYGSLGKGFAECHHRLPLAELVVKSTTKLEDLAIVCANCHRMLHRSRPMMSVEELANSVKPQ